MDGLQFGIRKCLIDIHTHVPVCVFLRLIKMGQEQIDPTLWLLYQSQKRFSKWQFILNNSWFS